MRGGCELVAAALFVALVPTQAEAHGGGLDGYGCHHNRKQGGYHCHRGPMAGQSFASQQEMLNAMKKGEEKTPKKTEK
jgi:hypothetical protein